MPKRRAVADIANRVFDEVPVGEEASPSQTVSQRDVEPSKQAYMNEPGFRSKSYRSSAFAEKMLVADPSRSLVFGRAMVDREVVVVSREVDRVAGSSRWAGPALSDRFAHGWRRAGAETAFVDGAAFVDGEVSPGDGGQTACNGRPDTRVSD